VELLRRHGRNAPKVTFVSESGKSVAKSNKWLSNIKQPYHVISQNTSVMQLRNDLGFNIFDVADY